MPRGAATTATAALLALLLLLAAAAAAADGAFFSPRPFVRGDVTDTSSLSPTGGLGNLVDGTNYHALLTEPPTTSLVVVFDMRAVVTLTAVRVHGDTQGDEVCHRFGVLYSSHAIDAASFEVGIADADCNVDGWTQVALPTPVQARYIRLHLCACGGDTDAIECADSPDCSQALQVNEVQFAVDFGNAHAVGHYDFDAAAGAASPFDNRAPTDVPRRAPDGRQVGTELGVIDSATSSLAYITAATPPGRGVRGRQLRLGNTVAKSVVAAPRAADSPPWERGYAFEEQADRILHDSGVELPLFEFGGGGGGVCLWVLPAVRPVFAHDQRVFGKQSTRSGDDAFQLAYTDVQGYFPRSLQNETGTVRLRARVGANAHDAVSDCISWLKNVCVRWIASNETTAAQHLPGESTWTHACAVVSGQRARTQLFVDGKKHHDSYSCAPGSACPYQPTATTDAVRFVIGNTGQRNDRRAFVGVIDDVYVLGENSPLTEAHVALIMDHDQPGLPVPLRYGDDSNVDVSPASPSPSLPPSPSSPASPSTSSTSALSPLSPSGGGSSGNGPTAPLSGDAVTIAAAGGGAALLLLLLAVFAIVAVVVVAQRRRRRQRRSGESRGNELDTAVGGARTGTTTTVTSESNYATFSTDGSGAQYEQAAFGIDEHTYDHLPPRGGNGFGGGVGASQYEVGELRAH